jgi:thiol-disulfide isomerase/thioredoxin
MIRYFTTILLLLLFCACSQQPHHPYHGSWRVVLDLGNGKELPFTANFTEEHMFEIYNAEEIVEMEEVIIRGDSIIITHPVFEGVLKGTFTAELIKGSYIKPSLNRVVPFTMTYGDLPRFYTAEEPDGNVGGVWETVFSPASEEERYIAKGIFEQTASRVTGTFRTTTGDYRYLEGVLEGDSLRLSTFDDAHAFLFEAKVTDSTLSGNFYSGNHFEEPFTAVRNENYELPKADSLTFLKEGYDSISFSFPNTEGEMVSLSDPRFKGKVVVVQIMGTWCPNCLDETRYFTRYYHENRGDDLEFVSLAFEYAPNEEKAMEAINRLKEKVGVPYPILLAQAGSSDKSEANEKLPMLNHVLSYPTTIFIDKKGVVRRIHTGFNGPATGDKYTEFVEEFENYLEMLRSEE